MWPFNPVDPAVAMRAAAESYAFSAALVSIPMTVAAILLFLFARHDLRAVSLAAATLCVHPLWTVTETWYDNGAALRLASTVWIVLACFALFAALFSTYRYGIKAWKLPDLRFTIQSLVILTTAVAILLVLARPPIAHVIPASQSVPAVGLTFMLFVAFRCSGQRRQNQLPDRIEIPLT
jgi:hypothetical protein